MSDENWYYNYFMQFVDKPAKPKNTLRNSTVVAGTSTKKREEEAAAAPIDTPVPEENSEGDVTEDVSDSMDVDKVTPTGATGEPEKVIFGKAPKAILADLKNTSRAATGLKRSAAARIAAVNQQGKPTRPASLDLKGAEAGRKSDGDSPRQPAKKARRKSQLTDTYPGLAKFK